MPSRKAAFVGAGCPHRAKPGHDEARCCAACSARDKVSSLAQQIVAVITRLRDQFIIFSLQELSQVLENNLAPQSPQ